MTLNTYYFKIKKLILVVEANRIFEKFKTLNIRIKLLLKKGMMCTQDTNAATFIRLFLAKYS